MFSQRFTSLSPSPTSSPSSSPPLGPCDSSPASSPISRPLSLSPPASPGVADPFAASTKGTRQPRIYEKRVSYGSTYNGTDDGDVFGASSSGSQPRAPSWSIPARDQSDVRTRTTSATSTSSADAWLTPARHASASRPALSDSEIDINLSDEEDEKRHPTVWKSRAERERALWDGAIDLAYQKLDGIVDLQQEGLIGGHGLTSIPSSIAELNNLVILPCIDTATPSPPKGPPLTYPRERIFSRSHTVPAAHPNDTFLGPTSPRLAKSSSLLNINNEAKLGSFIAGLRMYLGNNAIKSLPPALFTLKNLVLLNLRNNRLTHIPPEIASLTRLRELIIAQNKLAYLPAEMVYMRLDLLTANGNPWLKPPTVLHGSRLVTEVSTHFAVPSLTEYCLRALVSPYVPPHGSASLRSETVLEALGGISSSSASDYPPDVVRTLKGCVPGAVAQPDPQMQASPMKRARRSPEIPNVEQDTEDDSEDGNAPSIGYCKSPVHGDGTSVFIRHAVERMSWETVIGGQKVTVSGGVPVLWRGCMRSCLDFLDAPLTEGERDGVTK